MQFFVFVYLQNVIGNKISFIYPKKITDIHVIMKNIKTRALDIEEMKEIDHMKEKFQNNGKP